VTRPAVPGNDDRITARLFIAAWPDEATVGALARLLEVPGRTGTADGPNMVRLPDESWHVTLRFLGTVALTDAVEAIGHLADLRLPSTVARLGPAVTMLGRHVIVPVTGVDRLAAAVAEVTNELVGDVDREFFGHVTIGRIPTGAVAGVDAVPTLGRTIDIAFPVRSIALVRSDPGPDRPWYRTVCDVPIDHRTA
jgi:2'-5' RNA ligase